MKILHVEAGSRLNGGPYQVLLLLEGLARRGVTNLLLCPAHSELQTRAATYAQTLPMDTRNWRRVPLLLGLLGAIRQHRPDLVHVHSRRGADYMGALAGALTHTPRVLSRRVDNPEPGWLARRKYRCYDHVIVISEGIHRVLRAEGVPEQDISCVRSAIDPAPFDTPRDPAALHARFGLPPDARVAAVVAQLISRKGHCHLLAAMVPLIHRHPALHLLVFGRGGMEAELRARAAALGLDGRVHFVGFEPELYRCLPSLDLVIHPALMEGLGVSLIQAAAAGLPIVASQVGGIPEIVRDGENGLLVPPGDVVALASAVTRILDDPALAARLGARGRAIAREEFGADTMIEGNLAVYRAVLAARSRQ